MFSRALRQSSRRVAAVSASGRLASVSPSNLAAIAPAIYRIIDTSSNCLFPVPIVVRWSFVGAIWLRWSSSTVPSTDGYFSRRSEPRLRSSTPPPSRSEAMLSMLKPHLLRSLRSSSSAFEVSRRRPASPRLDVFSPSGMPIPQTTVSISRKGEELTTYYQ